MSTNKSIRRGAPYRSKTFNDAQKLLIGSNGVLSGGLVTTSGLYVTVQPMSFVQNGLVVSTSTPLTTTAPTGIKPPYFLAVTTSSSIENLGEVITPTFAKRPEDVTPDSVLVAEFDGQEWRQLPLLSMSSATAADNDWAKRSALAGIASGFDASQDSSSIYIGPGSAHAADGSFITKQVVTALPKIVADSNFDRVDEVVLRRPLDTRARIATLQYVAGQTFDNTSGSISLLTPYQLSSASPVTASKTLNNPTTDALYFFYVEGTTLKFVYAPSDLSSYSSPATIATGISAFDATLNRAGSIELVYTKSTTLYYKRITTTGTTVFAETTISTSSTVLTNPKVVELYNSGTYELHVLVERVVSITERHLGYLRLSTTNSVLTPYQILVDLNATLTNPSLVGDEAKLYLAFENQDLGKIYLAIYDASTATPTAPPVALSLPQELQDNTYNMSGAVLLGATGAKKPTVVLTAAKQVYVFWLHTRGSGKYGVASYNVAYQDIFGYKAILKDLYASTEDVDQYSVSVDGLEVAHFILREQGTCGAANLRLVDLSVSGTKQVLASAGTDVSTLFTTRGALIHSYANASSAWIVKSSATTYTTLRDAYLPPSDVSFARYRTSDGKLSVAGTALEEDITIRRLYELNNLFPATGTVTWGGSADHKLTIQAAITIQFFNRRSTYTIAANSPAGITVPDGSVCYVEMPDDDTTQTLALKVAAFGAGTLDRLGRKTVPLFWAVAGVLYTKFAPFRLDDAGETVIIGEGVSENARLWLGLPSQSPDPTNHAYSSTFVVSNADDYNTAIGKLDQRVGVIVNSALTSIDGIGLGATSLTVTLPVARATNTYRLVVAMENLVDTDPQFQPVTITAKATNSFTVTWNSPTDSANYKLDWQLVDSGTASDLIPLASGSVGQAVVFGAARTTPTYRLVAMLENQVDSGPQFQPVTITAKNALGFTASWNAPLDSANYVLNYVLYDT